jgi:hypothetical protein
MLTTFGVEVLIAVTIKSTVLWDVTPCRSVEIHWRFGRISHIQESRVEPNKQAARNRHGAAPAADAYVVVVACFSYSLNLKMEAVRSIETLQTFPVFYETRWFITVKITVF